MKLFLRYIRQKWRGLVIWAIFCILFFVFFLLYHLPVEAVLYPAGLCALLLGACIGADFWRVKKKHDLLLQCEAHLEAGNPLGYEAIERIRSFMEVISNNFPDTEGIEEEDYRRLLQLFIEGHNCYRTDVLNRYSDRLDYYTAWAHQIKTPIASMRLHLQNEDSSLSRKLSGELFRVEQYVEMVLTYLRLDSDSTDYVIKEYDLDGIIREAVKKFAGEFINRKLSLSYEPVHARVITDKKWLSFVIEQVLSNALKYTNSGSITITLDSEKRLYIRDTGIGIVAEDLPRIFENGYTGYNGRSHRKASGIGLYLCKRICTNLGHTIRAESAVDKGTTIIIGLAQRKIEIE